MLTLKIAFKNLKDLLRDFKSRAIIFILPVIFISIFGLVFGKGEDEIKFPVAIIATESEMGKSFYEAIKNTKNGSGKELFQIKEAGSLDEVQEDLEKGNITAALTWEEGDKVHVKGDTASSYFTVVAGAVQQVYDQFTQRGESGVVVENIKATQGKFASGFQMLVPGLMVYGILLLMPQVIQSMGELSDKNYTFRLFTSKVTATEVIAGNVVFNSLLAIIQTLILFGVAHAFGFTSIGNIWLAGIVAFVLGLFVIGLSLLFSSFFKKSETAQNLSTMLTVILGFLSGSFIMGIQTMFPLFSYHGREIHLSELLPTYHATTAFNAIFLFGKGLDGIVMELGILAGSALFAMFLGIFFFKRNKLSQKN